MNHTRGLIMLGAVLASGLCSGHLVAQSNAPAPDQPSIPRATVPDLEPTQDYDWASPPAVTPEPPKEYAPALDGTGLIPMNSARRFHLLTGATMSGGWDSNPDDLAQGGNSVVYTVSPYLGEESSTPRTKLIVQYQPTISRYSGYTGETMHIASAKFLGDLSERWKMGANSSLSHGQDSIRFLSPNQSVNVGTVSGIGPGSASYLPNAGVVTDIDGTVEFSGALSLRDSVRFQVSNSYSSIPALHETSSVATLNSEYVRTLRPSFAISAYQRDSQDYGSITCTTFGGGLGIQWRPTGNLFLSLSGGPQLDLPACKAQQGFAYSAMFSLRLPHRAQTYFQAAREPASGYLGPGLWQDSVTAGYLHQLGLANVLGLDMGYVQTSSLLKLSSYQGTYASATYSHRLRHGPVFLLSYRNYNGNSSQMNFTRSMIMFSVSWSPNAHNLTQ